MTEPIAYIKGKIVPNSEAKVPVADLGLVLGTSVTEMVRTFRHQPFHLDLHLERMLRSLTGIGISLPVSQKELVGIIEQLVTHNAALIPPKHDLGIVIFVTPGENLTYHGLAMAEYCKQPTLGVHTFPLPFEMWAEKFSTGQHLITPSVRHIPAVSIDPKLKQRSRMHWYLADQQARLGDPKAAALVLDQQGNVTETSTANFFLVSQGTVYSPRPDHILGGVSQMIVVELLEKLGIPYRTADMQTYDVFNADEAFTSSTPYCLLPVTKFNGRPLGEGTIGPIYRRLITAWSEKVGFDIVEQMQTGARERFPGH
ncbi:MAG: aminotransferase class IV [Planctomycetota bacterium]|nr:aminotransferase class IV [Planctomycetota bacterium]MDA1213182.1 aminotransferase class IV [Planctomycetota bacterium]